MTLHARVRLSTSLLALLAGALLLVGGCKDKSSSDSDKSEKKKEGKFASCNVIKQASSCRQYNEDNLALGEKHIKDICDVAKGEFKMAPCPKEKRIGICVKPEGSDVFYSEGGLTMTPAEIEKMCTGSSGGKWEKN
jgi:hypothetical protein